MTYYRYDEHSIRARARFDTKWQLTSNGCWEWQAYRDADGYGEFTLNVPGKKYRLRAHRFSWIMANGQDWPTHLPISRHLCNNPCCVNPGHIVPGTAKENAQDAIAAGTHYNGTKSRRRPVLTPMGRFESGAAAARAHGMRHPALIKLLKQPGSGFQYE